MSEEKRLGPYGIYEACFVPRARRRERLAELRERVKRRAESTVESSRKAR